MYPLYSIPMFVTSALALLFGGFVFWKRRTAALNQLFAALALSVAWWSFGFGMMYCSSDPTRALSWSRFGIMGAILIPTVLYQFVCRFLHLSRPRTLVFFWIGSACAMLFSHSDYFLIEPQLFFWGYYPSAGSPWYLLFVVFFYLGFGLSLLELTRVYRLLKTQSLPFLTLEQVQYVFRAYLVATCSITDYLPNYGVEIYPCAYIAALGWIMLMAYAVLKYRLMDVQLIVRRTLIYSFVSAILTLIYFTVVNLLSRLPGIWPGAESLPMSVVTGGLVALTFLPIFRHVQYWVDRLFFRFRMDRESQLMEFSSEIVQIDNLDRMTQTLYRLIENALHPKRLALYVRLADQPDFVEVAHMSTPDWPPFMPPGNVWHNYLSRHPRIVLQEELEPDHPLAESMVHAGLHVVFPLLSRGELLGYLFLGEKHSEEPYSNEDFVLLRTLLNQATVAYERPRLMREVTSGFVHEIKMPLANIALPAELTYFEIEKAIREHKPVDQLLPKIQTRMKYILDQAFLASHRIDGIQALSQPDDSQIKPISIRTVIQAAWASLTEEPLRQGVEVSGIDSLPDVAVPGDARQLEIVFSNLIRNALESVQRAPEKKVTIRLQRSDGQVRIHIHDTGEGVSKEIQEKLFSAPISSKALSGRGVGLMLAWRILKRHQGAVNLLQSSPGSTEFVVTLPEA